MPRNTIPLDDLDYIKSCIARGKPLAAKRVQALLDALDALRCERDELRAQLALAHTLPTKPWYE